MVLLARHPLPAAVVTVAIVATAGVFLLARPQYRPQQGVTIKLPSKSPANNAPGAAGWVWKDGTPGWMAGYTVHGFNVSGLQPVELQSAQLAAARSGLDAQQVRVLNSTRSGKDGVLAILAAPTLDETPVRACLAALLAGDAPVTWQCPGARPVPADLENARVLVAAKLTNWKAQGAPSNSLYLVGVARGDVRRVVLQMPGQEPNTLYTRGGTWGQFDAAVSDSGGDAMLNVYGDRGLTQKLRLSLTPGQQRIFR